MYRVSKHLFELAVILVGVFVALSILIELTASTFELSKSIKDFLNEWAVFLSASIALVLVIVTLVNIREIRTRIYENEIRRWATEILDTLTRTLAAKARIIIGDQVNAEIMERLQSSANETIKITVFAGIIGGDVLERMNSTRTELADFHAKWASFMNNNITQEELEEPRSALLVSLGKLL